MAKSIKIKPLQKDLFERAYKLFLESDKLEAFVEKRVQYVLKTIAKAFKQSQRYFEYSEPGFWNNYNKGRVCLGVFDVKRQQDIIVKDSCGKKINLSYGFPARWLYEDFEPELKEMAKEYFSNIKKENKNIQDKINIILSKLTKEEATFLQQYL